jgi:hypothetical protein
VDLLILANHKEGIIRKRGIKIDLERGDIGFSEVELAERWKWSRGKVRRFLTECSTEKDPKITPKMVQQNKFVTSCYHVNNYELYQGDGTASSTANGQQTDSKRYRNKNDKNEKNDKNKDRATQTHPTLQDVKSYFAEKGYKVEVGIRAFEYYDSAGWKDSKGNPVRNWKQKMIAVWMKDENKAVVSKHDAAMCVECGKRKAVKYEHCEQCLQSMA